MNSLMDNTGYNINKKNFVFIKQIVQPGVCYNKVKDYTLSGETKHFIKQGDFLHVAIIIYVVIICVGKIISSEVTQEPMPSHITEFYDFCTEKTSKLTEPLAL